MRTKVLFVNEASVLNTGYSVYGREVMSRLYQHPQIELAELAVYLRPNQPEKDLIPWKYYFNNPSNEQENQQFNANFQNQFGAFKFEEVSLDFNQHVTIAFRDNWMDNYILTSPYRKCFAFGWMPTVDAERQDEAWLNDYVQAEGLFTYQDWSGNQVVQESGDNVNYLGSAPPAAAPEFHPLPNRKEIRSKLGLENKFIIGTVMRNQRRKLYPDLFEVFAKLLEVTQRNDLLLYCHVSYPDSGFDIPKLLLDYGLSSKTLFTYTCTECKNVFHNFFSDALTFCNRCGKKSAGLANVHVGADNKTMATIYNLMDLYCQYSNSEGFGIGQVEAASCGTPVIGTDYSAMQDVIPKLQGKLIPVQKKSVELETGCLRAQPSNNEAFKLLCSILNYSPEEMDNWRQQTAKAAREHYNWDNTAKKWLDFILSVDVNKSEKTWRSKPYLHSYQGNKPDVNNVEFAQWLIRDVLGEPNLLNTYFEARLIRDLNYGCTTAQFGGMYFTEMSALFTRQQFTEFNREKAVEKFTDLVNRRNNWEYLRGKKFGLL